MSNQNPVEKTKEEFAGTATAAKLSGAINETAGLLKRKFGELTDDSAMKEAGREQQMLGKIHRLVGTVRGVREAALQKFTNTQKDGLAVCKKHGGRIIDVASDLVDDIKKAILK
jgi:uncharacterized protein YjbJ (UPF0337 family)